MCNLWCTVVFGYSRRGLIKTDDSVYDLINFYLLLLYSPSFFNGRPCCVAYWHPLDWYSIIPTSFLFNDVKGHTFLKTKRIQSIWKIAFLFALRFQEGCLVWVSDSIFKRHPKNMHAKHEYLSWRSCSNVALRRLMAEALELLIELLPITRLPLSIDTAKHNSISIQPLIVCLKKTCLQGFHLYFTCKNKFASRYLRNRSWIQASEKQSRKTS